VRGAPNQLAVSRLQALIGTIQKQHTRAIIRDIECLQHQCEEMRLRLGRPNRPLPGGDRTITSFVVWWMA
ncbi:MAG: hypothetical protein AAFQ11_07135, partial [Pseudomonadota bacterium]